MLAIILSVVRFTPFFRARNWSQVLNIISPRRWSSQSAAVELAIVKYGVVVGGALSEWSGTSILCAPITQSRSSCRLRSSYRNRLAVPSVKLSILSVVLRLWPYCLECSTWLP